MRTTYGGAEAAVRVRADNVHEAAERARSKAFRQFVRGADAGVVPSSVGGGRSEDDWHVVSLVLHPSDVRRLKEFVR